MGKSNVEKLARLLKGLVLAVLSVILSPYSSFPVSFCCLHWGCFSS